MNNKSEHNNIFNLNHKANFYLINNHYDVFENNEWNMDEILSIDSNFYIDENIYENEYRMLNKRYSFPQKKVINLNKVNIDRMNKEILYLEL